METCLSAGVSRLVCVEGLPSVDTGDCHEHSEGQPLTDQHTLNWQYIQTLLSDLDQPLTDYRKCVRKLGSVYSSVAQYLGGLSPAEFAARYHQYLTWTANELVCLRCFECLKEDRTSCRLQSLLLSTAVLERALGDLFLVNGKQCPSLLKDLLVTKELDNILGSTVIGFLRVLIGPPTSLNLRNLVWHGFPGPEEIPLQYCYVLLMVIASIGRLLEAVLDVGSIQHRPPVTFDQADKILPRFTVTPPAGLSKTEFKQLCLRTDFILPQFLPVWEDAFDLHKEKRYGECVSLMFPLMENGLRLMFAKLNHCPHRVLTAESSVLYTTFDEILSRCLPEGQENQLLSKLKQPLFELLQDLMVYPEGPRFRDRLGHGEASFQDIPQEQATSVWLAALALIHTFTSPDAPLPKSNPSEILMTELETYTSVFHPVSLLVDQLLSLADSLSLWQTTVQYTPELSKISSSEEWMETWKDNAQYTELLPLVDQMYGLCTQFHSFYGLQVNKRLLHPTESLRSLLEGVAKSEQISLLRKSLSITGGQVTVPSPCGEDAVSCTMEVVSLLRKAVSEGQRVSSNVQQSLLLRQHQLEAKQLRSRQRDTFRRLLISLPCLCVGLRAVIIVTISQLVIPDQKGNGMNIRFLKGMLQYCENIRTNTTVDKNKWSESAELTQKFLRRLVTELQGHV